MSIIGILAGIALPQYRAAIIQAKEAVLREDLFRFRDTIDQYQADKGIYPASLEALVEQATCAASRRSHHGRGRLGGRCRRSPTPTTRQRSPASTT